MRFQRVLVGNPIGLASGTHRMMLMCPMVDVLMLVWSAPTWLFRSRARLELEILALRQQINKGGAIPEEVVFRTCDRLVFVGLYRLAPDILDARWPLTVVCWHRRFDHSGVGNPDGAAGD